MRLKGLSHKIAWVDLASSSVAYEEPEDETYRRYLGGYGLGAYYLYSRQRPGLGALSREANLGFLTGPLTGTPAITGNRFTVVGKSPKSGGWGDANCGGRFGPALKHAGLDAVFVTGIADVPVYLRIAEGEVSVREASALWGLTCGQSEENLRAENGRTSSAVVIGPMGERVRALACIINDKGRAAARSGLGMVMGSKRLKAVVAIPGNAPELASEDELRALRQRLQREYCSADNVTWNEYHTVGTPAAVVPLLYEGDTPVKNWSGTAQDFPGVERVGGDAVRKLQVKGYACWSCPIGCGGHVRVAEGPYASEGHKPEYETIGAFGSLCLNDSLESICYLNNICNEYGMDTISAGGTLAFAMECFEAGLLSKSDLGGVELTWGNHSAMVAVLDQIARGQGVAGELLGDGVQAAAKHLGANAQPFAIACGGEELAMHDPRCYPGIAASYLADATPGRHTQGGSWFAESAYISPDMELPVDFDKYSYATKGEIHKWISCFQHAVNIVGLCQFSTVLLPSSVVADYLTLATGQDYSMPDVLEVGERAANLRVLFNHREGVSNIRAFHMPGRALGNPPLVQGPTRGVVVDNDTQVREYYRAMDWDVETGVPSLATVTRLGLTFALDVASAGR